MVRFGQNSLNELRQRQKNLGLYVGEDENEKVLVVCSFTEKETKLRVPKGFDLAAAKLVLTNYVKNNTMTLKPYETRVYLVKK